MYEARLSNSCSCCCSSPHNAPKLQESGRRYQQFSFGIIIIGLHTFSILYPTVVEMDCMHDIPGLMLIRNDAHTSGCIHNALFDWLGAFVELESIVDINPGIEQTG